MTLHVHRKSDTIESVSKMNSVVKQRAQALAPKELAGQAKLEENGYIATAERKSRQDFLPGHRGGLQEKYRGLFCAPQGGNSGFPSAGKLLFMPMWEAGMQKLRLGTDPAFRADLIIQPDAIPIGLHINALRTFQNDLLLNLYWQCLRYLNFFTPRGK